MLIKHGLKSKLVVYCEANLCVRSPNLLLGLLMYRDNTGMYMKSDFKKM